jgi:hypothetical protein
MRLSDQTSSGLLRFQRNTELGIRPVGTGVGQAQYLDVVKAVSHGNRHLISSFPGNIIRMCARGIQ